MSNFLRRLSGKGFEPIPEDSDLERFFTDAEYARQMFLKLIASDTMPKNLLVIHGVGGVGKSTLLKMYRLLCHGHCIPVGLVGAEDVSSPVDVLSNWADDLDNVGVRLRKFSITLKHYRSLQAKVEAEAKNTTNVIMKASEELGKAAAQTVVETAASAIPVIGPLIAVLGEAGTGAFVDWLHSFLTKTEIEFYLKPVQKLTSDFLEELNREAKRQRTVLMIDTYEQATALDSWIREVASTLSGNILLVIAGRSVPTWERQWPGWMGKAEIIELDAMSDEDLATLVSRYYKYIQGDKPDSEQVNVVVRFARGLPIVATTVVRLWVRYGAKDFYAVRPQVIADLVDRLLEGVPRDMLPAFEVGSILRYFNIDSLQALLDDGDAETVYTELRRWPFIRPRREGLAVHDTMREAINEALCIRTPGRFQTLNERATVFYNTLAQQAIGEERERLLLEKLYHQVKVDWQSGINSYLLAIEEAFHSYALTFSDLLIEDLSNLHVEQDLSCYIYYAKGLVSLANNRFEEATSFFQKALTSLESLDPVTSEEIRFKSTERLAYTFTLWGRLEEALQHYEKSVQLSARVQNPIWQIKAWNGIETVLRRLGYIGRAIEALQNSIRTCESIGIAHSFEIAWAQDSLGLALGIVGMWQEAVHHHQRAFDVYKSLGNDYNAAIVLHNMTRIMTRMRSKSLNQAIDDFEEALSVFRKLGDERWIRYCQLSIAKALIELGQWEEAEKYTRHQGVEDASAQIRRYKSLGDIQRHRGKWKESLVSYEKALGIAEKQNRWRDKKEILLRLSSLLLLQGKLAQAFKYVKDAEEMLHHREFYDHLAYLRLVQGHMSWNRGANSEDQEDYFNTALEYYQQALIFALRYNRFLLDKVLLGDDTANVLVQSIVSHCIERGEDGQRMIVAIYGWWQTGTNDLRRLELDAISTIPEGIPLVEAERIARKREPGDGLPQTTVVEKIEQILQAGGG